MRATQKDRLQMFRRVRDFVQPMSSDPAISVPFRELEGVITRMTLNARQQEAHGRQSRYGTEVVLQLARMLRDDLVRPLVMLGRTIPADPWSANAPGERALSLPRGRDFEGLVTAAKGFHDAAIPYEEQLIAAGLPEGHLAKLEVSAEALRTALDERSQQWLKRASSTAGAQVEQRRGMRIVRLVDSLIRPILRADAGMLAAWDQAQRLPRVTVRGDGEGEEEGGEVVGGVPAAPVARVEGVNEGGAKAA